MDWDHELARRICAKVAKHHAGLFSHYPDIGRDDLVSVAMAGVMRAHEGFDPAKGNYPNYVAGIAHRRIIDLHRKRKRSAHREAVVTADRELLSFDEDPTPDDPDLATWLSNLYRAARRHFGDHRVKRGRPGYSTAQRVAMLALQQRLSLTCRGMEYLLASRPTLRVAIGVSKEPSYRTIHRAAGVLASFTSESVTKLMAASN